MPAFLYILKCSDDSYYTGSTKNIAQRFYQHQTGKGSNYTSDKLPVELVYLEEYERVDKAYYRERQIQGWSRKKKEALMQNDWDALRELAKCRNASASLSTSTGTSDLLSTGTSVTEITEKISSTAPKTGAISNE